MGNASSADGNGNGGHGGNGHRRADQPRSWLQPFLLLALEQWQSHGYELIRRMSAFGFETLDRGSVYRTLRQLEKDGLVTSGWDTSKDGPARRLYTLTDAGRVYLETCAASLRGYQMMLNQFFNLYHVAPPQADAAEPEPEAAPAEANGNGNGNGASNGHDPAPAPRRAPARAKGSGARGAK
ncbi:MAG: poly-beta-hydroxybutyrate-responsive repressor [Thermoleophilia bacterium]